MVAPIRFLSGRQQQQKIGVEGSTQDQKVLEVVGRAGIGTTIFDVNVELEVRGDAIISGILTVGSFNVLGVSTFSSDLDINASIDVDGHTELDDLNVSGVSTFASDLDINASIDVDGHTELDDLNVSGVSTFASDLDINASVDISNDLNVSGVSTFASDLDINASVDISNDLNVSGVSTFASDIDINASIDVDGHTELDNLNVSGFSTFANTVYIKDYNKLIFGVGVGTADIEIYHDPSRNSYIDSNTKSLFIRNNVDQDGTRGDIFIQANSGEQSAIFRDNGAVELYYDNSKKFETTGLGVSIVNGASNTATIYGPSNLIIDPMPVGVGTTSGIVRIKGDLYVDGRQFTVASEKIELADFVVGIATTVPNDILLDGAGIGIGTNKTFLYEYNNGLNPSLKSSENLNVSLGKVYQIDQIERLSADTLSLGTGTTIHSPSSNVLALGTNNLERVSISNIVDVNVPLNVDAHTELDDLNVSGISTFASNVDINASVDIQNDVIVGGALTVSGISTFASDLDINASIDVDGHTELDDLNVSGVSTFASDLDINASADIQNDIIVGGALTVSGISTFASDLDINSSVDISNNLYISGITTSLGGIQAIGIQSNRSNITSGVITTFNFVGTAISTITNTDGFVEFNFKAGKFVKNVTSFTATQGQTVFSINYVPGYIDVYLNGVRLTASEYTATNGTSIVLPSGTIAGDIIDVNVFENSGLFNSSKWVALDPYNEIGGDIYKLDGNVGIGTTNATEKLEVDGNLKVSGIVTTNSIFIANSIYDNNNLNGNNLQVLISTGAGVSWSDLSVVPAGDAATLDGLDSTDFLRSNVPDTKTGVTTFSDATTFNSNLDINASIDVDGHTELDDLNVSGVSTFASDLDINASVDISNDLNVSGVSTFNSIKISTGLYDNNNLNGNNLQVLTSTGAGVSWSDLSVVPAGDAATLDGLDSTDFLRSNVPDTKTGVTTFSDGVTFSTDLNVSNILQIEGSSVSISTTTAVTIDTLSTSSYRSAKFQVQITQSANYQSTDLMVIHNGTTSSLIEYGSIATNDYLGEFSSTISGSNLLLQLTMNTDTSANVKVVRYGVTI